MQTQQRFTVALGLLFALALCSCASDGESPARDAATDEEEEVDADGEQEADAEADAGAVSEGTVPLTVWVDDLIEQRTSDEAEPDTVDDKKISDDTDETSFDKYLP